MSTAERLTLLVSTLLVLLGASAASADEPGEAAPEQAGAAEHFREGLRLYEQQEYAAARAAFEEANRLQPDVRVLANIADCQAHEGDVAGAVMTYRRFLAEAGDQVAASARRLVERRLADLEAGVCNLRVAAEPEGALILVDGREVGAAPMSAPIAVAPGPHEVRVQHPGHEPVTRVVAARAGAELEVAIALSPSTPAAALAPAQGESSPPARREPPARVAAPRSGPSVLVWSGVGLTAALAIGGTITGLLALSNEQEYSDPSTPAARRRELYDDRATMPLVADVLIDSAVVVGLVTLGLYLFGGSDEGPSSPGAPTARLSPRPLRQGGLACDLRLDF